MSHPRHTGARRASAVLEALRAELAPAQARLDALLDTVRQHRHDPTRAREVATALDEIASGRLHRLRGHTSFHELVAAELGISRSTAHRWRRLARRKGGAREKPELPAKRAARAPRSAIDAARALASRLRRRGVDGVRVEVFVQDGEPMLRIELAVAHARVLG